MKKESCSSCKYRLGNICKKNKETVTNNDWCSAYKRDVKIENGWRLYSTDFSIVGNGVVTLVRDEYYRKEWHKLPDELKDSDDCQELFVSGTGKTIEDAVNRANKNARCSKNISGFIIDNYTDASGNVYSDDETI